MFGNYLKFERALTNKTGDGTSITTIGIGILYVESCNGYKFIKIELQNITCS